MNDGNTAALNQHEIGTMKSERRSALIAFEWAESSDRQDAIDKRRAAIRERLENPEKLKQLDSDYEALYSCHPQIAACMKALGKACEGDQLALNTITTALSQIEKVLIDAAKEETKHIIEEARDRFWGAA